MPLRKTPIFQTLSNRTGLRLKKLRANKFFDPFGRFNQNTATNPKYSIKSGEIKKFIKITLLRNTASASEANLRIQRLIASK